MENHLISPRAHNLFSTFTLTIRCNVVIQIFAAISVFRLYSFAAPCLFLKT